MEKTTSQKALKVISIIMIVFAALTLLLGIGGIATGGFLGVAGVGSSSSSAAMLGGVAIVASLVIVVAGVIDLLIGIFGLRGANDPRKIGTFYVLSIIGLAFAVLSALGTVVGGDWDSLGSAIIGLVLPGVCVLLAYNIKKENAL